MKAQMQQRLIEQIQLIDSVQLAEVLDFTEFFGYKSKISLPKPDKTDSLYGKYRDHLSGSYEFAKKNRKKLNR